MAEHSPRVQPWAIEPLSRRRVHLWAPDSLLRCASERISSVDWGAPPRYDGGMDPFDPPASEAAAAPTSVEKQAKNAAILGIMGLSLHAFACCLSILGSATGLLCGAVALYTSKKLFDEHGQSLDGEALAYANVGWYSGLVSTIAGLLVVTVVALYMLIYVVIIVVAVGAELAL